MILILKAEISMILGLKYFIKINGSQLKSEKGIILQMPAVTTQESI